MTLREIIQERSQQVPWSGCWIWMGALGKPGYGTLNIGKREGKYKYVNAHRASYEAFNGEIEAGKFVCHKCDVRACVNPDHLFVGTHQNNMDDAVSKGRVFGKPNYGEQNGNSKLTAEKVRRIREVLAKKEMTQRQLAKEMQVDSSLISAVWLRKVWK